MNLVTPHAAPRPRNFRSRETDRASPGRALGREAMQFTASFDGKRRGMRPIFLATHDGFVGNEPGVAAAAPIASAGVAPARDVTLVGVRNTEGEPIDRSVTFRGEMENVFVAVVQIPRRTDRFEMAARNEFAVFVFDRDRLDPMDRVLEDEQIAQPQDELVRQHRIRR